MQYGLRKWFLRSIAPIGVVVLVVASHAASAATRPTIDTITTAITSGGSDQSSISLVENSTKTVYIHGSASDVDGCIEIDAIGQWTVKAFRENMTDQQNCTADKNNCYSATSGSIDNCSGGADTDLDYEGSMNIQYYADATDAGSSYSSEVWVSFVKVIDDTSKAGYTTDTWEMSSLIALNVTSSINYGTIALGADSAEQTITFTNTGNRDIDADQTATGNMTCTGPGSSGIAVGAAHISATQGFTYGTGDQALTTTATTVNMSLAQRTDDATPSTDDWYAILRMPATGVGGTCTNTVTFTAKADS